MLKAKIKKIVSKVTIFAVISIMFLSSSALPGKNDEARKKKSGEIHATGLKQPTKEDLDWMKQNMNETKKVLPNEIGLIKQLLNNGYILTYGTCINSWRYKTIKDDPSTSTDNGFTGKKAYFMQDGSNGGPVKEL